MCKIYILVLVISHFGLFGHIGANILQSGQCENIAVDSDFSITEFSGRWEELRRTGTVLEGSDCSILDVEETTIGNETGLIFSNRAVNNNFLVITEGTGTHEDGIITLNITGQADLSEFRALLYSYNVYTLLYSCENVGTDNRQVTVYLLQRENAVFTDMMTELIISTLNSNLNLTLDDLRLVDHSDTACYELPELPAGEAVVLDGLCDSSMPAVLDFQAANFTGVWHQLSSYYSESSVGTCSRAEYSLVDGIVIVENSEVVNQTLSTISGTATVVSSDASGRLLVRLEISPGVFAEQELLIIGTDYTSFAVSYSCVNLPETNQRRVFSWILSRTPQITSITQNLIDETLVTQLDLNERYYLDTPRSDDDCFYFPEPDGQPVVFRGLCDQNISVKPDFDLAEYLGIWHSIESYPSQFIFGSCVTAEYSLREDGAVGVLNSQVVGESLVTIEGFAVVANASEAAKLLVTFPIEGTNETITSGYWVLDTDYTSYSLVYTCVDLENNERAVTSWKLSRSKSLNTTILGLMDDIIDTIQVLDNMYYQEENQTTSDCFYYPEPVPGQVVIFPGQCEDIATVSSFNLTEFAGTWYGLEAYPQDHQNGHCRGHVFDVTGTDTLSLESSQIIDQFLVVNNGEVTADSANNARLTINITVDDDVITIPFWILSTDYEDYALAYGCVNRGDHFRAVYSWKLGRSHNISNESINSIETAMLSIDILNNTYFEPIDHSLDACFYLPDLEPGEPVILVGQCDPNIPRVQNFRASEYNGTWKLLSTYPAEFQNGTCQDARYTLLDDGSVEVYNTQVIDETLDTITGSAVIADDDGLLLVTFPGVPQASEYWILDTDYTSFSLVYSCVDINERERRIYSWILSRNETLPDESLDRINSVIDSVQVLNNRYYQIVNRTAEDCFYFPVPDGNPVVFRGQCDQDIAVVQNFNATAYLGLWHNIESYPSLSQIGTCNNAEYSLGDDVINVFNTEVVNQTLSAINGIAYINDDEPAKLLVTFPSVTNATADYWILDTDYDSYALVYSCVNLDEEYRQVWSWKLSRTKELTDADRLAINQTASLVQVVDERYFVNSDQSPEGCFYYPDAIQGVPVVFPGQCNNSIPVVSDFNITLFDGRWHEIDSYPTGLQQGDCLNHIISPGTGNTWNVVSNGVANLSLSTDDAILSVASTTEPGKLTITFTTATGGVITRPFWILDTDYENYALAYSCVDNDDDTRNVYSWKLSRSRNLNISNTIDNTIDSVDVLRSDYYWPVDQTDDACFFLPDLQPGEPAIFPGQCDLTIPVVPNFDATRYLGRWRLISTYPSASQLGACNEGNYSLANDGSIIVYNTEVVNQSLISVTGSAQLIENGKLLVTLATAPEPIEYWILDTDYDSYALAYSCVNINEEQRQVWSWKMGRSNYLNETVLEIIDNIIDSINVLDNRYFDDVNRTEDDCFYFPEVTGEVVRFRGQCNESISVVDNFNVTAYEGIWYAIESYPQEFQFGTCQTAKYTVNEYGTVDVYNTQVFEYRLDTINGTAVLANDDGLAKLNVTFPLPGFEVTSPYWVLDTDYDSYALVYSCVNIDEEYYRVGTWKLSRERNVTNNFNTAINSVMDDIRVLDQRYFVTWGHSDEQCFYYPPLTDGKVLLEGECGDETINVVENFNATAFHGQWFEVERFPSELQSGECTANNFDLTSANTFTLTKTIIYNERLETFTGQATFADDGTGVLSVDLSNENGSSINLDLYILDTDYTNYALLYSCRYYDETRKQVFSWKLSRSQEGISDADNVIIDEIVRNTTDLFEDYYTVIGQNNAACFYYPEFVELPEVIDLPGPCDDSIVGIPSFDINAFSGRWFELARYPHVDQSGSCNRVHFTSDYDIFDILSTNVINQTLNSQAGRARLASNDGSGVIEIAIAEGNEVPVITNIYILATDYDFYALAYSCQNLNNGRRLVSSWKLSRERTLSTEASQIIDEVIENTQGLNNEYYLVTDQADEACFYIPEVTDQAPVFRQTCENLTGQENFDIRRFVGWWHEIESYPRDGDAGDCISSIYDPFAGTVRVADIAVFDLTARILAGTLQADSNGRVLRFLTDGTVVFMDDIWVLATDYETYALLYSCENVDDNEYRRVWSAKYSKSRISEFPAAAQTVMDSIISENQVLYPQFYQTTDQSDGACFYYPELVNQQVILPGQCDENIPVIENFDIVEYTGTWYITERYYQINESGECSGTRYSVDQQTGEVTVLNWEVVDDELETVEGTAVISSADGSGKLTISLAFNGTEVMINSSLYVLTTDYVTYSLVYSCVNVDEYHRAVGAWKLSRTRMMPGPGTFAINSYMATREELHQPYFIQVEQNDDCEEPNSSVFVRSSIIVTLICLAVKMLV